MEPIRITTFRKEEYIEFLSLCKNAIVEKNGSVRIDEIEVISTDGYIEPGSMIKLKDIKYNKDTIANPDNSYIIKKTTKTVTENNSMHTFEYRLIYKGKKESEYFKDYGITGNITIYNDLDRFYLNCKRKENITSVIGADKQHNSYYKSSVDYTVLDCNKSEITSDLLDLELNRTALDAAGSVVMQTNEATIGRRNLDKNDYIIMRETHRIITAQRQSVKYAYIVYKNTKNIT